MRVARGWGGRFVWGFGRDVGEERLARPNAVAYEGLSFPAEDVGNIVTVTLGEVLFSAVVIHVKVEHPTSRFCGEPVVPAQGYRRQIVSVEVFAEEPGPVTGIVQARGYVVSLVAVVLVALPTTIGTITVTPNPRIMGVLATHDGGPGGAAQGGGYERVLERHALRPYEVERLRHIFQVVFTHIVGEDKDEVRWAGCRLGLCRRPAINS